ncbi:multicopper oxidase-domain-containing protein [Echria macrotheca]|uniref:Multicopper oxidase-domain-containing protein n=1 Tax=Echria macrotheca TaxID=438768 RepID=A0AAJ0FBA9_9PEZI|nr:multicopper oxidase-domain-containing protein [Echria macrotheca]
MKFILASLLSLAVGSYAVPLQPKDVEIAPRLVQDSVCEHSPTSRRCWGDYSIFTNYYEVTPPGRPEPVEYWLSAEEGPCAPDGYQRTCMTFNGSLPGPTIIANWGDLVRVHVTNNMKSNGTSIHWHGVRMLNNVLNDGVPGVTQCPIAPGQSMTYEFRVTQYGSSWYHSHFSLQYTEGLFGGMIFRGPSTANYDEDLGTVLLQDWSHIETFNLWAKSVRTGAPARLNGGLINGTNTFNCAGSNDTRCTGQGKKFETVFKAGTKYLLRLVNVATDGVFQFSIDGHKLKVIASDFVAIHPFETDSIQLQIGQRYDVIVEANAAPGDYWMRSGWVGKCSFNDNPADMTGIVRYDAGSKAAPNTTSTVVPSTSCRDEPASKLVPWLELNVTNAPLENLKLSILEGAKVSSGFFQWTINSSSLVLDWKNPTMGKIFAKEQIFPTPYNVIEVNRTSPDPKTPEWAVFVIQDSATTATLDHPIHLHGHDFWILAQEQAKWDPSKAAAFNTVNPPRRDVATLPGGGYLALAFQLDNPGAWLVHCHIAWHASQGLSLEFVEDVDMINIALPGRAEYDEMCKSWDAFTPVWPQEDSGI